MFQATAERPLFRIAEHTAFRVLAEIPVLTQSRASGRCFGADRNVVMFHERGTVNGGDASGNRWTRPAVEAAARRCTRGITRDLRPTSVGRPSARVCLLPSGTRRRSRDAYATPRSGRRRPVDECVLRIRTLLVAH